MHLCFFTDICIASISEFQIRRMERVVTEIYIKHNLRPQFLRYKIQRNGNRIISGHGFYYMSNQKIWQYADGKETVIVERARPGVQKGVLLYQDWILDSTGTAIDIYDKEGTLINTVDHTKVGETSQETMTDCYLAGVDENGLYLAFITMDYMHFLYYAEMGDVVSEEEVEWKLILENF